METFGIYFQFIGFELTKQFRKAQFPKLVAIKTNRKTKTPKQKATIL